VTNVLGPTALVVLVPMVAAALELGVAAGLERAGGLVPQSGVEVTVTVATDTETTVTVTIPFVPTAIVGVTTLGVVDTVGVGVGTIGGIEGDDEDRVTTVGAVAGLDVAVAITGEGEGDVKIVKI